MNGNIHLDIEQYYELLRGLNPHLPAPENITGEVVTKTGLNQVSTVTIEVFIKLPTKEAVIELLEGTR